jgi:phosphoribosylanthranilate isomerase
MCLRELGTEICELGFMTWVKICGITNPEDAMTAVDAGADALGFVFYEKSARNIDEERASEIVKRLPVNIEKVGVFVVKSGHHIPETVDRVRLTGVQLQIDASSPEQERAAKLRLPAEIKRYLALPAKHFFDDQVRLDSFAMSSTNETAKRIDAIFLDSGTPQQVGGTGRVFDWEKARPLAEVIGKAGFNLTVAGGLTSTNVGGAIRILKPWGVDVSSGVEASPGKKDPEKVRAFIAAVRTADQNH